MKETPQTPQKDVALGFELLNLTPQPLRFELIRLRLTPPREGLLRIPPQRL